VSLKRVAVLLAKESLHGPRSYIFIFAIVAPVLISLVLSLALGTLFSEKPKLGILDEGESQLVALAQELDSITTGEYGSASGLRRAVERGAEDMGIVLPSGFDAAVSRGETVTIEAYVWGEGLAKNHSILAATLAGLVRDVAGQEVPVEIQSVTLGEEAAIPWGDRLLPLVVLMAVFLGGLMLPATSVIEEKEKGTLQALVVTPTTTGDVFVAKGLVGVALSLVMGIAILLLNQAFGGEPLLLVGVLMLGAVMAVELGLLCGALIKDVTTLFALWKFAGILLFGPAIVYMFPQIPDWVGKVFPTYYVIQPIVEISQRGGGWPEIAGNVFVLIGLDLALAAVVVLAAAKRMKY
jgi:ABC-2 type transport system permease protein